MTSPSTKPLESAPSEAAKAPPAAVIGLPERTEPTEAVASSEPRPRSVSPTPSATPPRCALESRVEVTLLGGRYHVSALLRNLTAQRLDFELANVCQACPVKFIGFPAGYWHARSCAADTCSSPLMTLSYSLMPGEQVEVDAIDVDPVQTSCTPSVPPDRYQVSFKLPSGSASVGVCGHHPGTVVFHAPKKMKCPLEGPCPPRIPCF